MHKSNLTISKEQMHPSLEHMSTCTQIKLNKFVPGAALTDENKSMSDKISAMLARFDVYSIL